MKITLEWDNITEFQECIGLADLVKNAIKVRDVVGHILITNEVD